MVVSPMAKQFCWAACNAFLNCSEVLAGIFVLTRSTALSMRMPVRLPSISSTSPPVKVSPAFTPARSRATWLATAACPSMRVSNTGRSGKSVSSDSLLGNSFMAQSFWSQPRPVIHPSLFVAAKEFTRSRHSSQLFVPLRSTVCRLSPYPTKCACASIKPG